MTRLAIVMMEAKTIHRILILWHIGLINTYVDDNGVHTKFNYCKHSQICIVLRKQSLYDNHHVIICYMIMLQ